MARARLRHPGVSVRAGRSHSDRSSIGIFITGLLLIAGEPLWTALFSSSIGVLVAQVGAGLILSLLVAGFVKPWLRRRSIDPGVERSA